MKLINQYRALDVDQKDLAHCVALAIILAFGFMWLVSTNTYPRLDHATTDTQTQYKPNYELKGIYKQYAQKIYTRTYEK